MTNALDGCSDACGWVAAVVSAVAYGSFGVPIKETRKLPVHPLVLQSYKTAVMFLASWLVLLLRVKPAFTPWGLVTGALWVTGGTGGIYAIRMAGMAVAIGTWASVMILVNFVWGILVFEEPVANLWSTAAAFLLLIIGLVGMSKYSAKQSQQSPSPSTSASTSTLEGAPKAAAPSPAATVLPSSAMTLLPPLHEQSPLLEEKKEEDGQDEEKRLLPSHLYIGSNVNNVDHVDKDQPPPPPTTDATTTNTTVTVAGVTISKRFGGILGAVWNGIMTGSSLAPLHYAKKAGFGGANYMISLAVGSVVANTALWIAMFVACAASHWRSGSSSGSYSDNNNNSNGNGGSLQHVLRQTYRSMPCWYFRQLWLPGFMAGLLLAIGMFLSLLAITSLGQGIGNSVVQAKILISGLWGIFWYKEITGTKTISCWFLSAILSILGILWLSHERLAANSGKAA